ncbi:hypothetical protein FACS1894105_00150 [Clostridia bacterium]|nr:hypothetical protein FACS1894105_00150 [Clostridia bacterium]
MRCEKCRVEVAGSLKNCPLCQGDLSAHKKADGESTADDIFPVIPAANKHRTLLSWSIFGVVTTSIISIAINLSFPESGMWSVFVVFGILSLSLSFNFVITRLKNIPKNILWQVFVISVLSVLWDVFIGWKGWSVTFVIPILSACAMVAMAVVAQILHLGIEDYIFYLVIDSVLGLLQLIFILTKLVSVVYPSAISFACSVIFLAALFLFEGKALISEIQRRMHV